MRLYSNRRTGRPFALLCFLLAFFQATPLFANPARGEPPAIRDLYPLTSMHYTSTPHSAILPANNETEIASAFLWANTNAIRSSYTIDAETRELRFSVKTFSSAEGTFVFELPLVYRGGGTLDSAIDEWHSFWGLPKGRRNRVNDDSFEIQGDTTNGSEFKLDNTGTGLGNTVIGYSRRLLTNSDESLLINGDLRISLPTATNSLGHAGIDSFAGINVSVFPLDSWSFHLGSGALYIGDTELSHIEYARWRGEGFASVLFALTDSLSLASTLTYSSEIISNIVDHPHHSSFLDFGVVSNPSDTLQFTIAIREELVSGNGAQDLGLLASISYRFD